jgi:hypothetical protein
MRGQLQLAFMLDTEHFAARDLFQIKGLTRTLQACTLLLSG